MVLFKPAHPSDRLHRSSCPLAPSADLTVLTAGWKQCCTQSTIVVSALLLALSPLAIKSQGAAHAQTGIPSNVQPLNPSTPQVSAFSIPRGQSLMAAAESAIAVQDYSSAAANLLEARQLLNELTELYKRLNTSFRGIDNRTSRSHREKALQAAKLRDEATYRLAVVYRAQNRPDQAIPLLIEVIGSQPTRALGKQSYQQLVELGFVDTPFPTPAGAQAPPSSR